MQSKGYSKICLIVSLLTLSAFSPQRESSFKAVARVCAYMLMCVITQPSESHNGIYTPSSQLKYISLRHTTCRAPGIHGREGPLFIQERNLNLPLKEAAATVHKQHSSLIPVWILLGISFNVAHMSQVLMIYLITFWLSVFENFIVV